MKSALAFLFGLLFVTTSCSHYSTVRVVQPIHDSSTPAGEIITHSLKRPPPPPLVQLGGLLDATSAASVILEAHPGDTAAMNDYNFAVARIFEIIEDNGLEPWKKPLSCPGVVKQAFRTSSDDIYHLI